MKLGHEAGQNISWLNVSVSLRAVDDVHTYSLAFFFFFKKKLFNHFPLLSLAYHSAPGLILDVCLLATHRQMRICADKREANKHKTTSAI